MSELKSVLVHLDSTPQAAVRLKVAMQLAAQHGAVADALYAVNSALSRYPVAVGAGVEMAGMLLEVDEKRLAATRAMFARALAEWQPAVQWHQGDGLPVRDTARMALYADLLVLGQRGSGDDADADVPADFVPSVLIDSGRAALVLPYIAQSALLAGTVLVAWNETRECARAVTAALPLLRHAAQVVVVCFDGSGSSAETAVDSGSDIGTARTALLETYLHQHGVVAHIQHQPAPTHDLGEHLLSLVADLPADLLVMGCYGHGRAREWVMGGITRTVLQAMTVPVLMAH